MNYNAVFTFIIIKTVQINDGILAQMQISQAAGGCGSVCLPLDALDPERTQVRANTLRVGFNYERARFNNFRENDDDISNPGGNKAVITQSHSVWGSSSRAVI